MSDVFEALLKAQREVDSRHAPSADTPGGTGEPSGKDETVETPAAADGGRRRRFRWRHWLRNGASQNGRAHEVPLLLSPQHDSVIGEQFRVLRTHIETAGPGPYMVTSALDREGKTLCAINLAVALSLGIGAGVILVDADLRRPSAGNVLGTKSGPGFVECLLGKTHWQDCLQRTKYDALRVLPAGGHTAMAPELLGSERFRTLVAELRSAFPQEYMVFDAPPILLTADPMVMVRHIERLILVVRAGVTPRAAALKAIAALGAERFLGIVFNEATSNVSDYYYHGARYAALGKSGRNGSYRA